MEVSVAEQLRGLFGSLLLGAGLGLCYDLLRIARLRTRPVIGACLDFLFWVLAGGTFLLWSIRSGGQVRVLALICAVGGCWCYFLLFSPAVRAVSAIIADLTTRLVRFLLTPLRIAVHILKKIRKFFKNHFHYWEKWVKINSDIRGDLPLPRDSTSDQQRRRPP